MRSEVQSGAEADATDPYLPVEEVARRLDLPLGILLRRVEAGDVPSRRDDGPLGPRYTVRLSDLGFDPGTTGRIRPEQQNVPEPAPPEPVNGLDVVGTAQPLPPPPAAQGNLAAIEPRGEVASMTLDPRELVAGLLDRWERTLEQRIYAEQRMRFEAELNNRQHLVKQLQLELQAARAEQAAAVAERDRRLAEGERRTQQLQGELASVREAAARKRGLFRR